MDKFVLGMAGLRIFSGCIEIMAAIFMLRVNEPYKALVINTILALIGPMILMMTTAIGLVGLADKLTWSKIIWVTAGVGCLFIGMIKR